MESFLTEHDPSLGVSPTESPEASPNPTSEALEADSFLLGSEEGATDAQQINGALTTENLQHGPEAQAGTNAESQAADTPTANTPLHRGSANPLYEGETHASPWYARIATGLNYAMTPG